MNQIDTSIRNQNKLFFVVTGLGVTGAESNTFFSLGLFVKLVFFEECPGSFVKEPKTTDMFLAFPPKPER